MRKQRDNESEHVERMLWDSLGWGSAETQNFTVDQLHLIASAIKQQRVTRLAQREIEARFCEALIVCLGKDKIDTHQMQAILHEYNERKGE